MPLAAGSRFGPYEITALLGVGGMGEVYRATDTNLKRHVAIKVLPEAVASDPERLLRFQREAEVLASLNHPNIAIIHGLERSSGVTALVMELVDGPTLAERIASAPIRVEEALTLATQIAEALEAAHQSGVVHRDLKPANVKVRADGTVKVLDFGLAKAAESGGSSAHMSQSPTFTTPARTHTGVILGTAAYMSPEQARGHEVDRRTDVWAFGAVLYEMLTGRPAFSGDSVADTIAAIVKEDPDWESLPHGLSRRVVWVLRSCLQKDPKRRLRDLGDVRLALDGAFESDLTTPGSSSSGTVGRRRAAIFVAAGLLAGTAIGLVMSTGWRGSDDDGRAISRFEVPFRSGQLGAQMAFSPDGQTLVYRALGPDGQARLFRRSMDQFDSTPIDDTENGTQPFFSPDGRWLGFFVARTLRRVPASGGPPETITELPVFPSGATWDTDSIVVGGGDGGLLRVPLTDGETTVIAAADEGGRFSDPEILPGGRAILFTESRFSAGVRGADVPTLQILDLDTGRRHMLLEGAAGRFVAPAHLVFRRGGALWGVALEADRFAVAGTPVAVVQERRGSIGRFTVAGEGSLAYVPNTTATTRQLAWVNRAGREEAIAAPPRGYTYPRLSPDGTRVAIDVRDDEIDVWVLSLAGETLTRLTFDPAQDEYPVWTRDGGQILFASFRDKAWGVFAQSADGRGAAQRIGTGSAEIDPLSLSPDGRTLVARLESDVVTLAVGGSSDVQPLLATPFSEVNADISPDGRWIAYQSNESGRDEIYVRPFPEVSSGLWQVSHGGGTHPVWSRSGRELFYIAAPALMSAPVLPGPSVAFGNPRVVIEDATDRYWLSSVGRSYDVSPDGERFLMLKEATQTPTALQVVRNWRVELNRLVPTR